VSYTYQIQREGTGINFPWRWAAYDDGVRIDSGYAWVPITAKFAAKRAIRIHRRDGYRLREFDA
jgi:hypothetical protein